MTTKQFISANDFLIDSYKLARQVMDSGFRPDFLVGFWRGGTPVGIAVQEYLAMRDVKTDHIALRTRAYDTIEKMNSHIKVHGLDYLIDHANAADSVLLVDDVFDSGLTMQAVIREYAACARQNTAKTIRIATVYYKPTNNKTDRTPDFFLHKTDQWLVFPHELQDLSQDEIRQGKGEEIYRLLYE